MQPYRHVQHALWLYLAGGALLAFYLYADLWRGPAALVGVAVVALVFTIFGRLTTGVDEAGVHWSFGWGFPGGSLALGEIARAAPTQTSLLEGIGIHWTIWHGWLWNVSGFQGVAFEKLDGGRVTLGTDDPQGLSEAVERFRQGAAS